MTKFYRQGVGAVILNGDGLVFIAKRIKPKDAWQMPQGGINRNETPKNALLRELEEEIGTSNVSIIAETPLLTYELPNTVQNTLWNGKYAGQQQIWFYLKFLGKDTDFNLNACHYPEFIEWKWIEHTQLVNLIVDFKKDMYTDIVNIGKQFEIFK